MSSAPIKPTPRSQIARCPVCGAQARREPFFRIQAAPVTCASIFSSPGEARAVGRGDVNLVVCTSCGFVFNDNFDPALGDIGARYESSQAASGHFGTFARSLANDWVERYQLKGQTVLEVGCGGGDFLKLIAQQGVARAIGIDPYAPVHAQSEADPQPQFIADVFDDRHLDLAADALICRHTLEHIQDVGGFLRLLRQWTRGDAKKVLLFEVPDAQRVFSERAFWDVYYEHCNYFTAATLRHAFESAGFEVLRLDRVYGDQYLIIEAAASDSMQGASPNHAAEAVAVCREFGADVRQSIDACQRALLKLAAEAPPLVLWQGAAKTVGFLAALGEPSVIECAVDLSPARKDKFLPGSGLPVYAPDHLTKIRPGAIVLMNPVYLEEVRAKVRSLGLDATVYPVNALLQP